MAPKSKSKSKSKPQKGGASGSSYGSGGNQQVPRVFTEHDIKTMTQNFGTLCGQGNFARVYYGTLENEAVAVKIYDSSSSSNTTAMFEIAALTALASYPHIISLKGTCIVEDIIYLVLQFVPIDLGRRLQVRELSWSYILNILVQLAHALEALNNEDYVVGDIKPDNILVDDDGNAYLCDFGSARKHGRDIPSTNRMYTPKELTKNRNGTPKSDVYSYGCILLQMIMRSNDFDVRNFSIPIKTEVRNLSSAERGKRNKKAPNSSRASSSSPHVAIQARFTMMYEADHVVHKQLMQSGCDLNDAKMVSQLGIDCTEDDPDQRPCIEQILSRINQLKSN